MAERHLSYGIPDVELPSASGGTTNASGGTTNPARFAGHELIVLFCPADPRAAAREIADYAKHARALMNNDAWIIAVLDGAIGAASEIGQKIPLAADPGGRAWRQFQSLLEPHQRGDRGEGAVFLFGRGGALQRSWRGPGRAESVMRELRRRF